MSDLFLDLSRYDRFAVDTETKGRGRNVIPVGCSIATPDGKKRYMRWGHEAGGNNCTLPQFQKWANVEFGDMSQSAIFFNAPYDLSGLANINVQVKAIPEDAGVACYLLNQYEQAFSLDGLAQKYLGKGKSGEALYVWLAEKFGGKPTRKAQAGRIWQAPGDIVEPYAEDDGGLTLELYDHRSPELRAQDLLNVYRIETMVIPVLVRMFQAGVKIDTDRARSVQAGMQREFHQVKREWDKISGGIQFSQRKKLIEFFRSIGVHLPRTENGQKKFEETGVDDANGYSVAKDVLMAMDHPVGSMIRRMRQLEHYSNTFIQSYLLDNVDDLDFIYPQFHQVKRAYGDDDEHTGTITGRFSSSGGLNAQNIPARDEELAPLIRSMFIPMDTDSVWLKADYQAIEYRLFAHYAGGELRKSYQENPRQDLHAMIASMIFGIPLTEFDDAHMTPRAKSARKRTKTINFAKIYGAGPDKMALTIGCTRDEVDELLERYDSMIPEAQKIYYKAMNRGSVRGYITTWAGRRVRFQSYGERRKKYVGTFKALNYLCQGGSADLTKSAMIEVDQLIDWETTKMHLTVHDELDFSIPKGSEGVRMTKRIKEAMEHVYEFTVPIIADCKSGPDWGHAEEAKSA